MERKRWRGRSGRVIEDSEEVTLGERERERDKERVGISIKEQEEREGEHDRKIEKSVA